MPSVRDLLQERRPFDQLHDQGADAGGLLEAVNGRDVGMVQRREQPRLARESRHAVGIGGNFGRQQLDGDVPSEHRVSGTVDLAHATAPEQRENLVAADAAANHGRETRRWDVLMGPRIVPR